ncbi:MAG: FecR family protein [Gemmatimonadaceae bacterium]
MNSPDQSDTEFERIARQLAGEASELERAEFGRWLANPEAKALFDGSARDWSASALPEVNVDRAWSRLQSRLSEASLGEAHVIPIAGKRRWWRDSGMLVRAAAVGFVLVAGGVMWSRLRTETPGDLPAGSASIAVATKVAERTKLNLPDGTAVELAAASTLRTVEGYGDSVREVELTGEAVFLVTHDASRPFRVRTASALIEDLGTRFVVRAVGEEPVRVAVSEGSVSVRKHGAAADKHVVLQARDVAVLSDTGDVLVSRGVNVERYSAWTSGLLVFNNIPLEEAIADLERWHDIEFEVSDRALLRRTINTTLVAGLSIDEILHIVGTAVSVQFERQGRIVRVAVPLRTGLLPASGAQVGDGA